MSKSASERLYRECFSVQGRVFPLKPPPKWLRKATLILLMQYQHSNTPPPANIVLSFTAQYLIIPENKRRLWDFFFILSLIHPTSILVATRCQAMRKKTQKSIAICSLGLRDLKKKIRIPNTRWIWFPKITWKYEKNKTCCWKLMCSGTFVYLSHLHLKTSSLRSYPKVKTMWKNTWNELKMREKG